MLETFRKVIPDIVKEAGKLAQEKRETMKVWNKAETGRPISDVVTSSDIEVQEFILKRLLETPLKECKVFSEEDTPTLKKFPSESKYLISCDPIDGTLNYSEPPSQDWKVIIQLKTRYRHLVTCIYWPDKDQLLWIDDRMTLNGEPLNRRERKQPVMYEREPDERTRRVCEAAGLSLEPNAYVGNYLSFARGEIAGMHRKRINAFDGLVYVHIARVLGGISVELKSGAVLEEDYDYFSFVQGPDAKYYEGSFLAATDQKLVEALKNEYGLD